MIELSDAYRHLRLDEQGDPALDLEVQHTLAAAVALAAAYAGKPPTPIPYDVSRLPNVGPVRLDAEGNYIATTYEERDAAVLAERADWLGRAFDAAVLLILGELWRCRESGTSDPLSPAVKNILNMFKKPTYA